MHIPLTFSLYLSKQLLKNMLMVLVVVSAIVVLVDSLELLRQSKEDSLSLLTVMYLALLKLPTMIQKVLPFAILISSILTFTRMSKTNELIIVRAAGVSVWQFMIPAVITAFLVGILMVTAFNPFACALLSRYETVSAKHMDSQASLLSLSPSGLWLKQKKLRNSSDPEAEEMILHARQARGNQNITIYDIIIFVFGKNDSFLRRIDANRGVLASGYWHLFNVDITEKDHGKQAYNEYFYRTDLSIEEIYESLTPPETISFWELPLFIDNIQKAGFSAAKHRLHWHTMLASPLFFVAMVMIGAVFSLHPPRSRKAGLLITASIVIGFLLYFLTNVVSSLGLSGSIPLVLAVWTPIIVSSLLAVVGLLHFEDG